MPILGKVGVASILDHGYPFSIQISGTSRGQWRVQGDWLIDWLVVAFSILHHSEKLPWKRGHALLFLKDVYNRKDPATERSDYYYSGV